MQSIEHICQKSIKQTTSRCLSTDYHNVLCVSMRFQKDGVTPGCSIAVFIVGGDPLEGQLVNSRVPEIATLFASVFMHASFHHSGVNRLRTRSSCRCIAATKFIWTAMILMQ